MDIIKYYLLPKSTALKLYNQKFECTEYGIKLHLTVRFEFLSVDPPLCCKYFQVHSNSE